MSVYPFRLIDPDDEAPIADSEILARRPFALVDTSFEADARRFVPGDALATALNTAIAVGDPLLITGEPGTGKTQTAYYAAYKLGVEPVIHFQVKSDTTAGSLLYDFDAVRYFRESQIHKDDATAVDKASYVEARALWQAMTSTTPRVVLIDEIDKAPRDFPNDLLHELDKMEFVVSETQEKVSAPRAKRPIVIITSNSERRLPEPFLRRCVYHHIHFDKDLVRKAVDNRRADYAALSDSFLELAVERFLALRERDLRKIPATGELLVWLRVLALATGTYPDQLDEDLAKLPYLSTLLKDHKDGEEL
jgi:MoxR-like ATPase